MWINVNSPTSTGSDECVIWEHNITLLTAPPFLSFWNFKLVDYSEHFSNQQDNNIALTQHLNGHRAVMTVACLQNVGA